MPQGTMNNPHQARGAATEAAAERWLSAQGLVCVTKNFRCKLGEIDLIMLDGKQLVFVEVRFRKNELYGSAAESVTHSKQQRVIRAAQLFIETHPRWRHCACRFDVLGVTQTTTDTLQWQWLRDAFVGD
ncbi:MAG TPA: YraN family protein [Spongiibacteraceae bacterium]|nr:YraN family protein [Spongiibacteraceae bacterium]